MPMAVGVARGSSSRGYSGVCWSMPSSGDQVCVYITGLGDFGSSQCCTHVTYEPVSALHNCHTQRYI